MRIDNAMYCYNVRQARFLLENGCPIIDIGIHNDTNRPYWVFKRGDMLDEIMILWQSNKVK